MTFNFFRRAASAVTAALCLTAAIPAVPLTANAELSRITTYDGYDYEYWSERNDHLEFELDNNGGFNAIWNTYGNCYFAKGLIKQKPTSLNYKIDYDVSINFGPVQNATAYDACTYLCAHGFLKEPAAEFFFADYDSDISHYEDTKFYTPLGSFTNDGKTYDLYTNRAFVNSIEGSYSYDRYISIRRGGEMKDRYEDNLSWGSTTEYANYSGQIDVGAHFEALEKLGKRIGDLDSLSFNVESYRCSGEVRLNSCELIEQPENTTDVRTTGTFESKGGSYSYSSTCRPGKITLRKYKENNEPDFDFLWNEGTNRITKELISEPEKIGANDLLLIKEDYSFELHGDKDPDNCFSGILEMDMNDNQKVFLVDTGINISEQSIADMYTEGGIDAKAVNSTGGRNVIKLTETIYAIDKRPVCVYPFTYTITKDGKEETHTDYWIVNYGYDTYKYNQNTCVYSENEIIPDTTSHCYHIHKISEIFNALKDYGLSAETLNAASFTFNSEKTGGSLTVNELTMSISHFPDGAYFYSPSFYGMGDFSMKPNENGLYDFEWYNRKDSGCNAEAGRRFDGDGLDLTKVESIVAEYSGTVDSVEIFSTNNDPTAVYLHGRLPFKEGTADEFFIDVAYLGNRDDKKKKSHLASNPTVEDNGKTYDICRTYKYDKPDSEYASSYDDEYQVYYQYWSMEQEPPINGEDPAKFSGQIDITKHLKKFRSTEDSNKLDTLMDLTIGADTYHSVGNVKIDKFDITVTYKDGTVEKYTPYGVAKTESGEIIGDLNGDGRIDSFDIVLCRRELLNTENSTSFNKLADMDGNGTVQLNDLVLLTRFVLGK